MEKEVKSMAMKNRIVAKILALTAVFVILFSFCFIIAEANHDCIGDDCSVCGQINIYENLLKSIGNTFLSIVSFVLLSVFTFATPYFENKSIYNVSLVSLKVKLSE